MSTQYTVTIDTSLKSTGGTGLHSAYTFSFTTAPLAVKLTYPQNGSTGVELSGSVNIRFNAAIDELSAARAFSISPAVDGSFFAPWTELSFYPSEFAPRTLYTVKVDTSLYAYHGGNLLMPYSFSFTTGSFGVRYTTPANGSINHPVNSVIYVVVTGNLDSSSIPGSFSIMDSLGLNWPAGYSYYRQSPTEFVIDPVTNLAPGRLYTVTISTAIRSRSGYVPEAPYVFSFRTAR